MKLFKLFILSCLLAFALKAQLPVKMVDGTGIELGTTRTMTATIASGTSLSSAVSVRGCSIAALIIPASWTAAVITFQVSMDGVTYYNYYNSSGSEPSITVASSTAVQIDPALLWVFPYIIVRSGTAATPVTQSGAKVVTLVCR